MLLQRRKKEENGKSGADIPNDIPDGEQGLDYQFPLVSLSVYVSFHFIFI